MSDEVRWDMFRHMKVKLKKNLELARIVFILLSTNGIPDILYITEHLYVYMPIIATIYHITYLLSVKYEREASGMICEISFQGNENHRTHRTFPMARPKCHMRDFTNLNRIFYAHRTNVWWIMKAFRVHWSFLAFTCLFFWAQKH